MCGVLWVLLVLTSPPLPLLLLLLRVYLLPRSTSQRLVRVVLYELSNRERPINMLPPSLINLTVAMLQNRLLAVPFFRCIITRTPCLSVIQVSRLLTYLLTYLLTNVLAYALPALLGICYDEHPQQMDGRTWSSDGRYCCWVAAFTGCWERCQRTASLLFVHCG